MKGTFIRSFIFGVLLGILIFAFGRIASIWMEHSRERELHSALLEKVEELGNLELVRYRIKDAMVMERGKIPLLTRSRVLAIISGEAVGCIDLRKITEDSIRVHKDTVFVHLPEPHLCHYSIDHENTHLYDMDMSLLDRLLDREESVMDTFYARAERRIMEEALNSGILSDTRRLGMEFMRKFLSSLGFHTVIFKTEIR